MGALEELALARNSGIHTENPSTVDLTSYRTAVEDVKKFVHWVVYSELRRAAEDFGIDEFPDPEVKKVLTAGLGSAAGAGCWLSAR